MLSSNVYCLLTLVRSQNEILDKNVGVKNSLTDLAPGWSIVDRLKDTSDVEWSTWKYLIQTSWFYFFLQFIISEIIRVTKLPCLRQWYVLSSVIYILLNWGWKHLIILMTQPVIFAIVIFCGGKKTMIWLLGVVLLLLYNSVKYQNHFWKIIDSDNVQDEEVYLVLFAVAWIKLKCISFCIDYIDKKNYTKERSPTKSIYETLLNMLSYVLYAPMLHMGPIMVYEDFEKGLTAKNEKYTMKLKTFFWDILLFVIYGILLDLSFHYVYFNAMESNVMLLKKLPTLALCGGGLWMGISFYLKYLIAYGTTEAFARLDNMEPPPTPRCVLRIHIYSMMWRYFDVGLYIFLLKYIYKPTYHALSNYLKLSTFAQKLLASSLTFLFIFVWHGTTWTIFVWSSLNYIGIVLENTGRAISTTETYQLFKNKYLRSNEMEKRLIAMLSSPLLVLSAISNFYLLGSNKTGSLYFELLKGPLGINFFFVSISLYCCCQVSMALKDLPSRTDKRKVGKNKSSECIYSNNKIVAN